jgi:acyl carrier protein
VTAFHANRVAQPNVFLESNKMTTDNMKEEIRQYILSEFLPGEKADNLQDDTPLRTSGILDSVATLRLVTFVEERFGIQVEAHEASVENFDSINSIAAFIDSKKTGAS